MSRRYSEPIFGSSFIPLSLDRTGAVNGTVGATTLVVNQFFRTATVSAWGLRVAVGGTEASVRKIFIGKSLAGTGAVVAFGTITLGTLANNSWATAAAITATNFAVGDQLVIQHLGTGAAVYDLEPWIEYSEQFTNA